VTSRASLKASAPGESERAAIAIGPGSAKGSWDGDGFTGVAVLDASPAALTAVGLGSGTFTEGAETLVGSVGCVAGEFVAAGSPDGAQPPNARPKQAKTSVLMTCRYAFHAVADDGSQLDTACALKFPA
jgi:hypothetical protein